MADYTNRVILYTGAAGGLGLPGTLAFLDRGATVVVFDLDVTKIANLENSAIGRNGKLVVKRVDLGSETSIELQNIPEHTWYYETKLGRRSAGEGS